MGLMGGWNVWEGYVQGTLYVSMKMAFGLYMKIKCKKINACFILNYNFSKIHAVLQHRLSTRYGASKPSS